MEERKGKHRLSLIHIFLIKSKIIKNKLLTCFLKCFNSSGNVSPGTHPNLSLTLPIILILAILKAGDDNLLWFEFK